LSRAKECFLPLFFRAQRSYVESESDVFSPLRGCLCGWAWGLSGSAAILPSST
jgi:hypothetical protein